MVLHSLSLKSNNKVRVLIMPSGYLAIGERYINCSHLYRSEFIKNSKRPCSWWIFFKSLELRLEVIRFVASEPPSVIAWLWTIYSLYSPNQYVVCSCNLVSSLEALQLSVSSQFLFSQFLALLLFLIYNWQNIDISF